MIRKPFDLLFPYQDIIGLYDDSLSTIEILKRMVKYINEQIIPEINNIIDKNNNQDISIENLYRRTEHLQELIDAIDVNQGEENAGKIVEVKENGRIGPATLFTEEIATEDEINFGSENEGFLVEVGSDGFMINSIYRADDIATINGLVDTIDNELDNINGEVI